VKKLYRGIVSSVVLRCHWVLVVNPGLGEMPYNLIGLAIISSKAFRRVESRVELSFAIGFNEWLHRSLSGDGSCTAESERRRE
jgi:hypothetical protein